MIANVQIFTYFVILETPEDDNYLSISFGRPFLMLHGLLLIAQRARSPSM
jgi:hypothetical protein